MEEISSVTAGLPESPVYGKHIHVAVPCRKIISSHFDHNATHIQSAVPLIVLYRLRVATLCRCVRYLCVYEACVSLSLTGSLVIQHFEQSDVFKMHNGIII